MPRICYQAKTFSPEKLAIINQTNRIINTYTQQGFSLTLRQLYYVFVGNNYFPATWKYRNAGNNKWVLDPNGTINAQPNYDRLGDIISDARMAGLIDWNAIVDRTRASWAIEHWDKPSSAIKTAHGKYAIDKWLRQPHYAEVWVEKESLEDVLSHACNPLDIRYFACRGYTSQSSMWEAAQRLLAKLEEGKQVHIIHLGDHDPSGIDMSRDIYERLSVFTGTKVHVRRIALNMAQIRRYNPPPNWAKVTDSRFASYQKEFGDESWELDALRPQLLVEMITHAVKQFRDEKLWLEAVEEERKGKSTLKAILDNFGPVVQFLRERKTK